MAESFSEKLQRLRSNRKLTQQQLASKMYVNRSTIARWEAGARLPDLVLLPRLADCLGVDVTMLIPNERMDDHTPMVIVLDDEPPVLAGNVRRLVETLPDADITGFIRPSEALEFARNERVDLAFVDIEMGKTGGFEVCEKLLVINPRTIVVFLTAYADYALKAWNTGAKGYLVKPLEKENVIQLLAKLNFPMGDAMG